jgi:hypothetical protein
MNPDQARVNSSAEREAEEPTYIGSSSRNPGDEKCPRLQQKLDRAAHITCSRNALTIQGTGSTASIVSSNLVAHYRRP